MSSLCFGLLLFTAVNLCLGSPSENGREIDEDYIKKLTDITDKCLKQNKATEGMIIYKGKPLEKAGRCTINCIYKEAKYVQNKELQKDNVLDGLHKILNFDRSEVLSGVDECIKESTYKKEDECNYVGEFDECLQSKFDLVEEDDS